MRATTQTPLDLVRGLPSDLDDRTLARSLLIGIRINAQGQQRAAYDRIAAFQLFSSRGVVDQAHRENPQHRGNPTLGPDFLIQAQVDQHAAGIMLGMINRALAWVDAQP